jgi:hypothetical protein
MGSKKTTEVTPWKPAEPYIKDAMASQQAGYGQAKDTLAKWSPTLGNALSKASQTALNPPAYSTDARAQLDKTINGDYINANPYTGGIADLIAQKTQGQYNTTFGGAGRSHGGLAALLSSQGVGDALSQFYNQNYQNERGMQQQAIMAAPGFNQDEYTGINNLIPAVNNTAMMPLNAANSYGQGITGTTSPYTTTTQKTPFNVGQAIGLAAQIGSAFIPGVGPAISGAMGSMSGLGGSVGGGLAKFLG